MLRHRVLQGEVFLLKFTLNVNNRLFQEFIYSLPNYGTNILALFQLLHPILHELLVITEFEIPVCDRLHGRSFTCKSAHRVDEVFRHILVAHIALICIALFRGAAINRALTDDLTSVEENSCLLVEKLHSSDAVKLAFFV